MICLILGRHRISLIFYMRGTIVAWASKSTSNGKNSKRITGWYVVWQPFPSPRGQSLRIVYTQTIKINIICKTKFNLNCISLMVLSQSLTNIPKWNCNICYKISAISIYSWKYFHQNMIALILQILTEIAAIHMNKVRIWLHIEFKQLLIADVKVNLTTTKQIILIITTTKCVL